MKGWKTLTVFGLSALAYLLGWDELTQYVEPQWIAAGTAVVGVLLRLITTTPVGQSAPPRPGAPAPLRSVAPLLLCALAPLLFAGCAATTAQTPFSAEKPVIQLDYASFFLTYNDAGKAYAVAKYIVAQECTAGVRSPEQCEALVKADDRIQLADQAIRQSIADPRYPVDWGKVQQFLGDVLGALVKIGVRGAAAGLTP